MNGAVPARASRIVALLALALGLAALATPAGAQYLAPQLDRNGVDQRLRQPSLRLVSLGRLSLALDDENNEINQWDFGGSTVGLLDDRGGHALDLFYDGGGRSAERTVGGLTRQTERVDGSVVGLSAVARTPGKFAFGLDAGFQGLGTGVPREFGLYQDQSIGLLEGIATVSGRAFAKKVGWGARLGFARETLESRRRTLSIEDGELQLSGGETLEEVTAFDISEGTGAKTQFGLGLGWMASSWGDVSLNWDHVSNKVRGDNTTRRRIYEVEEPRGVSTLALTTTLRPASWVTLGGTVGSGGFDATESFRFTLSGGQGAPPLQGRGERLDRSVEGEFLKARVALAPPALPAFQVGADFNVHFDEESIDPADGPDDYNAFLQSLTGLLNLPPAIIAETQQLRHWDAGLGLGYKAGPRLSIGVEGHRGNDARDGTGVRLRRRVTDLRGGLEYAVTSSWMARVGAWRRGLDEDVYTANNEGVATAITLGAGYQPTASRFALDAGIEILDRSTDYPDPTDGTGSGFRFVLYNRWAFN
jgi:hypothetical protein